jgi:hypothetical protein
MYHNRIRRISAATGLITTVAGSGRWGAWGDGGPATEAALAGPAGVALIPDPRGLLIVIADYYNGRVRVVGLDGVIRDLAAEARRVGFEAPTRVAYAPKRGWLYVTDSTRDQIVPVPVRNVLQNAAAPRGPASAPRASG